ncbi:glycoside hydrolase family 3 protein [Cenococcum geophilum 1.58]|uniref:Glycoside hydrolase family 3 protein n=1 Tax=Cenococcum geophilum 1.58 TaxID=794803 RepID=A0ACC8ENG4_9PEZI|nr:glycoside hydrolase family 3 protein [Cenococcum geophilum 1.58]
MADIDVDNALSNLTLAEKCDLLAGGEFWRTYAVPRLGIPSLCITDGADAVRGSRFFNSTPSVCLPCGEALAATWNVELLQQLGALMGDECRVKKAHVLLSPTINIPRSPLAGRAHECFGEDPYLSGVLAGYFCRGVQEKGIIATPKHFVCNDQEQGIFSMDCLLTQRALREIYLLPFMLAIKLGNPGALMSAYNKVNGVHVIDSTYLLREVLRKEWKFRGLVMSDWFGMYSVCGAAEAGVDLEMPGPGQWRGKRLAHAVAAGRIEPEVVDDRARAVLNLVKEAALSGIEGTSEETLDRPEDRALLRKAAAESIVLMKITEGILPFDPTKPIAVIGPNAKVAAYRGGRVAHLRPYRAVSPFEAITERSDADVLFSQGIYNHFELPLLGAQMRTQSGEVGYDMRIYAEPPEAGATRKCLNHYELLNSCGFFFNYHDKDLREWYIDIEGTFTPDKSGLFDFGVSVQGTANLYVDGALVVDNTTSQKQAEGFFRNGTIEEVGSLHVEAGRTYQILCRWNHPQTSALLKDNSQTFKPGNIRLSGCHRLDTDDSIVAAAKLASEVEQVVVLAGFVGEWESEGNDRKHMDLPPDTDRLISAVLKANPQAAICISSGGPYSMPWLAETKALLQVWYGGNETGNAITDVLYGDTNPSGKLPLSFPMRLQDNPAFLCSHAERKRVLYADDIFVGYRYYDTVEREVLFPFGHGLSYTQFKITNPRASVDSDTLLVELAIANVGTRGGMETVQVYISRESPSVKCPTKELRGFEKVDLKRDEVRQVTLHLDLGYATGFWDEAKNRWICEEGNYTVLIGTSSRGSFERAAFRIQKTTWWTGI